MKKYIKSFGRIIALMLVVTLILSLLYYFNVISDKIYSYLELIFIILILYFNSMRLGRSVSQYSVLEGVKIGGGFVLLCIILNMIFEHKFNINLLVYYLLIFLVPILGSMKKKNKKSKSYWKCNEKIDMFVLYIKVIKLELDVK